MLIEALAMAQPANFVGAKLYTGTGAAQSIVLDVDLSADDGIIIFADQASGSSHDVGLVKASDFGPASFARYGLFDWSSGYTGAHQVITGSVDYATSRTGITMAAAFPYNVNAQTYLALSIAQRAGLMDMVSWTGNGDATRAIPHNLGVDVGFMFLIRRDATTLAGAYHYSKGFGDVYNFNAGGSPDWANSGFLSAAPDASNVNVLITGMNGSGVSYEAYVFPKATAQAKSGAASSSTLVTCGWQPRIVFYWGLGTYDKHGFNYVAARDGSDNSNDPSNNWADRTDQRTDDDITISSSGFTPNINCDYLALR